ncbi:hypothetical protein DBB36_17480 [Flavobacterium sp. WLB]|uniref:hypothetical protein n=1 Tax=unclassified Flavobacterium TaxID=196869 RepID=UPI0006ABEC8D|nr:MULTISPECIES: hypothetical protein [unclassified Flavobacterium]KOP38776.1 hypothetical protein AKO67_06960 [Flavobacterium sp. VMW]OWU92711.1 hypothetical protein APR43_01225 [Flavobacterium sp. NLM]PUU68718.1 hypothetical protein DBB36_17480 [Flavobacterium sp. WLB]
MHTVTPWSATAQADIENSEILLERKISSFTYQLYNTGDSLWIAVIMPNSGKIAFRTAFAMNSCFEVSNLFDDQDSIVIILNSRLGSYEVRINFPDTVTPVLHYTTSFTAVVPLMMPFWPRDIIPLTQNGSVENTAGTIHMEQFGSRSGLLFASITKPKTGSFFYFQNLTSLSEYCEATQTESKNTVGGKWPELGFQLPATDKLPLPAGKAFILSDAYVILETEVVNKPTAICEHFLNNLVKIYKVLEQPAIEYNNWPDIAKKVIADLTNNKGSWTQKSGIPYLNAYLCDYETPAESMVQLAVLTPFKEYEKWSGEKQPVCEDLIKGLPAFYDPKIKCINRWLPALADQLDGSEEQKKEMVMDSWYLHHPLMNLARLALQGNKTAEKLLLDSVDYVIRTAHHFNYKWPVFYNMETLEIIKKETAPGAGGENDVPGSYAHLMLLVYKLTKEKRYLNEAERAAKKLEDLGVSILYQANNTAFAAGALLELYKITKKKMYLDLSYICLAGLFKNVQLYDCRYGFGKNYTNFFSIFPLNDAPYTAAYEELEVYAALSEYLIKAEDVELLPAVKTLIPEFVKYAVNRIAYYYPPLLPKEMLSDEVKTGELQRDLWIPLEDLYNGWEKSGQVGQEVYGAGMAFGVVPRQYIKIDEDFLIFIDYPITRQSKRGKSITINLDGDKEMYCNLKILKLGQSSIKMTVFQDKELQKAFHKKAEIHEYKISGRGTIKIQW